MRIPGHLSDLSKEDFEQIARATNPIPGLCISIDKTGDGFKISIDEAQFKRALWAFSRNGGFEATIDNLTGVSLDPGS